MDHNVPPSHDRTADAAAGYTHDDPAVDAALDWFGRLRDGGADPAVLDQFGQWLAQDPRHAAEFRALEEMWGSSAFLKAVESLPPETVRAPVPRRQDWLMRAAAVAAVAALAAGIWHYPRMMADWRADYLTATGDRATVRLPDGSTMVLNTDSAVALDFDNGRREVSLLRGEAWFDVRHDPDHPFRVTGGFGRAEVKGTAFSLRREDGRDEVVLERGRVDVSCLCDGAGPVALHPGEAVTVPPAGPQAPVPASPERLAWREGRVMFRDTRLGEVVSELSRYYDGTIIVAGDRISRIVVTGNYRLDRIEGAIRTLADAAGVRMTRLPGGVIILR
ncbi:FecR family protein [Sinirhodobacter populi]|uniref:FecR family protein n=1 Tax=Paenirhodobacter populi TaxID=2306993 RepID=A0A443K1I6_9RHOB|nr:FecR family protein [Sinirhodobacter populi]RWR26619.1 FecR family protein [Sinirhodobacter populi]